MGYNTIIPCDCDCMDVIEIFATTTMLTSWYGNISVLLTGKLLKKQLIVGDLKRHDAHVTSLHTHLCDAQDKYCYMNDYLKQSA